MKDSAKLLNFKVGRELVFSVFRKVDVDPRRALSFNSDRELSFSADRDLGFGKRGVVFRGYVCPVCRAPVARDAPRCDECSTAFEQSPRREMRHKSRAIPTRRQPPVSRPNPAPQPPPQANRLPQPPPQATLPPEQSKPAPKVRSTFGCPGCGRILYVGVGLCPGCGILFASSAPPPPMHHSAISCPRCQNVIPAGDAFCRRCGSQRPTQQTGPRWDEYAGKEG